MVLPASATTISSSGNFLNDNDVVQIPFTVPETLFVTFQTFGFGGGVNGAGATILKGGFEPLLQVFNVGTGNAEGGTIFGGVAPDCAPRTPDPDRLNFCLDVFAQVTLGPGDYLVALTQNDNVANGSLGDGFFWDSDPAFRNGFVGTFGFPGDSHWALDITLSPEPGAALLIAPALLLLGVIKRRRLN